jgi:hypothetical protein
MNENKDNNGRQDWKTIYAQWDRERLEEELVRNTVLIRGMRDEQRQLQSRIRQLEEENRMQAAELWRLGITNQAFAARVIRGVSGGHSPTGVLEGRVGECATAAELEPLRQYSGRFKVSPADVMCPDSMPSRGV